MDIKDMSSAIEAILFVAGDPVNTDDLAQALEATSLELEACIGHLIERYDFEHRGLQILRIGQTLQMATRKDFAPYIERMLFPIQKQTLSQAAMETLAIIAYRQPVTRGEIEAIRGIKSDYSVSVLSAKGLIIEVGRRDTLGRPYLYGTTDAFLRHFGLTDINQLPDQDLFMQMEEKEEKPEDKPEEENASGVRMVQMKLEPSDEDQDERSNA